MTRACSLYGVRDTRMKTSLFCLLLLFLPVSCSGIMSCIYENIHFYHYKTHEGKRKRVDALLDHHRNTTYTFREWFCFFFHAIIIYTSTAPFAVLVSSNDQTAHTDTWVWMLQMQHSLLPVVSLCRPDYSMRDEQLIQQRFTMTLTIESNDRTYVTCAFLELFFEMEHLLSMRRIAVRCNRQTRRSRNKSRRAETWGKGKRVVQMPTRKTLLAAVDVNTASDRNNNHLNLFESVASPWLRPLKLINDSLFLSIHTTLTGP